MKKIYIIVISIMILLFTSIFFLPFAHSAGSNEIVDLGTFQSAYVEYPKVGIRQNMTNATFKYEGKWKYRGLAGVWYDVSGDFDAVPGLAELLIKLKTASLHDGFAAILDSIKNNTIQGNIVTDLRTLDQDVIRANKDKYEVVENKLVYRGGYTPSPTPSATTSTNPTTSQSSSSSNSDGIFGNSLPEYISNIYNWSIGVAAGLAVIMLIYAGYLYVTSAGNPESINLAKEIIIGAIAGFVFLILAALILRFVM
jgi:hypothetical protein